MPQLKIAFLLDSASNLLPSEQKFVIQQIRYCLYELRNSSFNDNCSYSLAFVKSGESSQISLYELDTFSINKQNQDSIFQQADEANLKDFYRVIKYSQTGFKPEQVMKLIKNPVKPQKETKKKKSPVLLKILIPILAACLILSSLPAIFYLINLNSVVYKRVYTGDGDTLLLRAEPKSVDLTDILLRLNEGEVVQIITEGGYWAHVEYHGFVGYVTSQYLIEAKASDYVITNPASMYAYGLACREYDDFSEDGITWIKNAAFKNLLQAQWKLRDIYRENDSEYLFWLHAVAENGAPYEEIIINELKNSRDIADQNGRSNVVEKYNIKIEEEEKIIKDIKFAALSKLAWEYLDKDPEKAGDYYLKSLEYGTFSESDFYNSFTEKLEGEQRIQWLEKAYVYGIPAAAFELASYYDENGDFANALACYRTSYDNNYARTSSALYIYKYYKKTNPDEAFKWLQRAFDSSYTYSMDYYYSAYYLGDAYEYGKGCDIDYSKALKYYGIAKDYYSQAQTAYNRIYNYYSWW